MMLWRGRLIFRQYIKNKKHKHGVKFYELCESDGTVLRASIYSGVTNQVIHGPGQTGVIVMKLKEDFLGKEYCVYTDNYYNSVALTKQMGINKTYVCSTLRADRQGNLKEVVKVKLKKGEMIQRSQDGVSVTKWKDKRDMLMISNKHSVEMVDVTNRRGDSKSKLSVIRDYNDGMSDIDKADQMISYHNCLRKITHWYKKVALHIIDIHIFNLYALHKKLSVNQKANLLEFRESIVKCLIKDKLNFLATNWFSLFGTAPFHRKEEMAN